MVDEQASYENIMDEDTDTRPLEAPEYFDLYASPDAEFDPRKRGHRRSRMPPQLARYWGMYDPRKRGHRSRGRRGHRARARPRMDPRRRHYTVRYIGARQDPHVRYRTRIKPVYRTRYVRMDPARRHRRRRNRFFDPAISGVGGSKGAFIGAILQPPLTALGSVIHGGLVTRYPQLAKGVKVGNNAIGLLGFFVGAGGAIYDWMTGGNKFWGNVANSFGSGFFAESVNVPQVERVMTVPTQNAMRGGRGGGTYGAMGGQRGPAGSPGSPYGVALPWYPQMQPGTF